MYGKEEITASLNARLGSVKDKEKYYIESPIEEKLTVKLNRR